MKIPKVLVGLGILGLGALIWMLGILFYEIPYAYTICLMSGTVIMGLSLIYGAFQMDLN